MIGTNIARLSKEKGLSIAALEKAAGLGNGVIRRWDEYSPRSDKLKAVADVLGVTVDELLREEGEKAG